MAIVYTNLSCNNVCTWAWYLCISLSVDKISPNSLTDEMMVEWSRCEMLPISMNVMFNLFLHMWLNIWRAYMGLRFLDLVMIWSGVMSITSHIARNTSPHVVGLSLMSVLGCTISRFNILISRSWFILFSTTNNRSRLISCLRLWISWYILVILFFELLWISRMPLVEQWRFRMLLCFHFSTLKR